MNRREFERRLQEAIGFGANAATSGTLCAISIWINSKSSTIPAATPRATTCCARVASLIKDAVRDSDTVGRIGGDEFALLLVGCPLEKARQIADNVVRSVNDYRFVWRDKIFNVGISIGLVEIGRDSGTIEDIMNSADSACYVAKKQGGSARACLFGARGGERASQRRNSLAAETARRAARQ